MAARPRDRRRKNWPAHLHAKDRNGLYYFWRHPLTGQEFGLGRVFIDAATQAIEANLKLHGSLAERRLVDKLADEGKGTVAEFIPVFRAIKAKGARPNTIKALDSNLRRIEAAIGDMIMRRVTTQDLNDKITEPLLDQGKERAAVQVRSHLMEMWKAAKGKGKVDSNPVTDLVVGEASVKRARLTLEEFLVIYEAAKTLPDKWVAKAMKLALVSAQPRECLVELEFSDCKDGHLWNERGKTGARIKLPLPLALPGLGWTLDEAVRECRDHVLSRHLLHHNVKRTKADPGDQIALNAASKGFQRARERTTLTWPEGKNPPSLHEIRSLALRIYRQEFGRDFAQALAGHKEGTTTDLYTDSRGAEWIEVRVHSGTN